MCGRFAITLPPEAMARLFEAVPGNDVPGGERFNVCPTQTIAVCTAGKGGRRLRGMRWGFLPHWYKTPTDGPLLINARSETVADKPAFRAACRERRCLVPSDGFYEWTREEGKQPLPWFIRRADGEPMVFGGIWQDWEREGESLTTCAIVTCEAGPGMSSIHNREPLVLEREDWGKWLGEEGKGAALLMKPAAEGVLTWHRVGTKVNSNRAEGAGLIEPI
ncbi:SOS response-associated peptidase [Ostreiculturibacter nitratireducens]|uniref:SOS response-associated peptidase n=1 Tax=Ostreiculturibacter nitratireducens TaxID=3075226 RepID=UPI0031B60911